MTGQSWKAIQSGKAKWRISHKIKELKGDICFIGQIKATLVPWISVLDIGGSHRLPCDLMSVLSTINSTEDFDLMKFQKQNRGKHAIRIS